MPRYYISKPFLSITTTNPTCYLNLYCSYSNKNDKLQHLCHLSIMQKRAGGDPYKSLNQLKKITLNSPETSQFWMGCVNQRGQSSWGNFVIVGLIPLYFPVEGPFRWIYSRFPVGSNQVIRWIFPVFCGHGLPMKTWLPLCFLEHLEYLLRNYFAPLGR